MKRVGLTILLILLMHAVIWADVSGSFIEALKLKSTRIEDAVVYYEPCLEEKLPFFKTAYSDFRGAEEKRVRQLDEKKQAVFTEIENIVGPAEDLEAAYEKIVTGLTEMASSLFPAEPAFYLIRQPTIKDYMRKGGSLPNFCYDKETDMVTYRWEFFTTSEGARQKLEFTFPVASVETFEADVNNVFRMISFMQETLATSLTIHEIAETSLVRRLKTGAPRIRWFTDGFANVVTYEILRKHFGRSQAEELLKGYGIEQYSELKDQINLQYWMISNYNLGSPTNPFPLEAEKRLELARYSYALDEAKRLVDAHGIECVRKIIDLFAAKTKAFHVLRSESIDDLYAAIQEVTGVDLKKRFLQYQRFATEKEGRKIYTDGYSQAKQENDREEMILNLLRKMELYESPFLPESQGIRREIAVLLSDLGHHDFADKAMHRWVIELDTSGKLSGIGRSRLLEIAGKAIFMTYALKANRSQVAVDYADEILEIDPAETGFAVPAGIHRAAKFVATTVKMHQAKRNADMERAIELAKRVCELKKDAPPDFYEVDLCYQMAQQILSETK